MKHNITQTIGAIVILATLSISSVVAHPHTTTIPDPTVNTTNPIVTVTNRTDIQCTGVWVNNLGTCTTDVEGHGIDIVSLTPSDPRCIYRHRLIPPTVVEINLTSPVLVWDEAACEMDGPSITIARSDSGQSPGTYFDQTVEGKNHFFAILFDCTKTSKLCSVGLVDQLPPTPPQY